MKKQGLNAWLDYLYSFEENDPDFCREEEGWDAGIIPLCFSIVFWGLILLVLLG